MPEQFKRGEQIAYIPLHAGGDVNHPDVEFGFVTSQKGDTVWCRFWWRHMPNVLRTTSCSELCRAHQLTRHASVTQAYVQAALEEYCEP